MPDSPMAEEPKTNKALQADQRKARLAAQLRSNLKKRRQQARVRADVRPSPGGRSKDAAEERS